MQRVRFLMNIVFVFGATSLLANQPSWNGWNGDLVHRGGSFTSLFAGHAGIFHCFDEHGCGIIGSILHIMPGFDEDGKALRQHNMSGVFDIKPLRENAFNPDNRPFYGSVRHPNIKSKLSLMSRLHDQISFYYKNGTTYDFDHRNQLGKRTANGYFEFDCVGFTEKVMEYLGYNPTPDDQQEGFGWPLSVYEQRDSRYLNRVMN